jgi:hypothetical protein
MRESSHGVERAGKKRGNQVNQSEIVTNRGRAANQIPDIRESYNGKPNLPDISPMRVALGP